MRFVIGARNVVVHAEIAATQAQQARGLMGRTSLRPDAGMIFVWPDAQVREFYMKDTLIPLELISVRVGRVVGIQHMVPCHVADCPITSTPPADAALEVNEGTAERAGITTGALVDSSVLR